MTILKYMKKGIAIILVAAIMLSGCSGSGGGVTSGSTAEGGSAAQNVSTAEAAQNVSTAEAAGDEDDESRAVAKRSQSSEQSDPTITVRETGKGEGTNAGEGQEAHAGKGEGAKPAAKKKAYTVMIYMVGSDLESRLGNATRDLEEIDSAELSYDDFNVIVYTGGSARWIGDVPCDCNCVLDMSLEGDERIVAQTSGNANMGLPETLSAFLNFCGENYPAEHNALILWNHGGGPLQGYGFDELYDFDSLRLDEMKTAMENSPFSGGRKLDLVGFDACLMASLESMTIWKDHAYYYVGSEELEPGAGWNYDFLKALEDSSETGALTESILSTFKSYYDGRKSDAYNPDLTLSCIDLSRIDDVNAALDKMADRMADDVDRGEFVNVIRERSQTKSFGISKGSDGEASYYSDLVDVGNLADRMEGQYAGESAELKEALSKAVVNQYTNLDDASGMTLYYPYKNKGQLSEMSEYYEGIIGTRGYARFLDITQERLLRSKSRDWNLGTPVDNGDEFTLQLPEEVLDNMTDATYSVLSYSGAINAYVPYMENCKIEPDKKGVIHVTKNPPLVMMRVGDESTFLRAQEVESGRKRQVYRTLGLRVISDLFYSKHIEDLESKYAAIRLSRNKKSKVTEILGIELEEGLSGVSGGKSTVDLTEWEGINILAGRDVFVPARDKDGRMRPYREWTNPSPTSWNTVAVDSGVELDVVGIDQTDTGGDWIIQIQVEDMNGEKYASEPVWITNSGIKTEKVEIDGGDMNFAVYEDHAKLIDYNGRAEKVEVPQTVSGVPVTVIGSGAFSRFSVFDSEGYNPLREVVLPGSVTQIGSSAFSSCLRLEKINLPEGVERIGSCAFMECSRLKEIEVPDSTLSIGKCAFAYCTSLSQFRIPQGLEFMGVGAFAGCSSLAKFTGGRKAEDQNSAAGPQKGSAPVLDADGAVYTADGTSLLAYPGAAGETFTVKEGTKKIEYGTFAKSSLKEVILPGSLEEIGNYAFYDCAYLKAPVLPEGISGVSMHAFDVQEGNIRQEEVPDEAEVIRLPASLERIGDHAFDKFINVRFEVSEDNKHYKGVDGALMNKAGDTAIQIPVDKDLAAVYPEGTVEFTESVLDVCNDYSVFDDVVRRIYLPESMKKFPDKLDNFRNEGRYAVYHCPAGSEAEKFAIAQGLTFTNEMERILKTAEVPTEKGTLYFDIYSGHAVLSGYLGEDETLEVPAQVEGKAVTAVGNGLDAVSSKYDWYDTGRKCPNLIRIVFPEGVSSINANALSEIGSGCEIVLPSTVRRLGQDSISSSAKVPALPQGLEILEKESLGELDGGLFVLMPNMRYIDPEAFYEIQLSGFAGSGDNEHYSVRDGVLYNADGTVLIKYPDVNSPTEFSVPEGTTDIGKYAFSYNDYLKKVMLPDSLKNIEKSGFRGCSSLEEIVYGGNIKMETIGSCAFADCSSLTEVTLPAVKTIGDLAFSGCEALHTVHFAEGTRSIGDAAFDDTAVAAPEFPDSLLVIGSYAFRSAYGETTLPGSAEVIRIPARVREIGGGAFEAIGNTAFEVDPDNSSFSDRDGLLLDAEGNELVLCPAGRTGTVAVPDGVTSIADYAFTSAKNVTDVVIPDSVIYIGTVNFNATYADSDYSTPIYTVTIHCSEGSSAETYAINRGIPYETE